MPKYIFYFVIAFMMSFSFATLQAEEDNTKGYIGISVTDVEFGSGVVSDTGWSLTYGVQLADVWALETAYARIIDVEAGGAKLEISALDISVLVRAPSQVSPFLRLGHSTLYLSTSGGGTTSEGALLTGVGVDFNIGERAAIRLEYNEAEYDDIEVERLQLGVIVFF